MSQKKKKIVSFQKYIILLIIGIALCAIFIVIQYTTNFFDSVPFITGEIVKLILGILQTLLVGFLVGEELKKNRKITKQALDLESQGIHGINKNGELYTSEVIDLFTNAKVVKIMVVCGETFFKKHENIIIESLKRGNIIRVLIANENSDFVKEITEQLNVLGSNEGGKTNNQSAEINRVKQLIEKLKKYGSIEVRQYNTEYRVPFYLGYFDEGDESRIKGWYNSVIPVCSPRDVLMFKGEILENDRNKYVKVEKDSVINKDGIIEEYNFTIKQKNDIKTKNIIVNLEAHFDYLWNKYDEK